MCEDEDIRYEQTLQELRDVVAQLQDQSLPLRQMLALYEKGMTLSGNLKDQLARARGRLDEMRAGEIVREVATPDD